MVLCSIQCDIDKQNKKKTDRTLVINVDEVYNWIMALSLIFLLSFFVLFCWLFSFISTFYLTLLRLVFSNCVCVLLDVFLLLFQGGKYTGCFKSSCYVYHIDWWYICRCFRISEKLTVELSGQLLKSFRKFYYKTNLSNFHQFIYN